MATKNIKREALRILKEFEVAGKLSTTAEITDYKVYSPRLSTQLIRIVFMKSAYVAVIDNTADDDTSLLLEAIRAEIPDAEGRFLRNPHENSYETYGVRHKFRDIYLFEIKSSTSRLDVEASERFPDISRSTIQKYIRAGYVSVDGKKVTTPKFEVTKLSDIALFPPERKDTSKNELPILYIDDNVIVVNKPTGVLTHSKGALNDEFTVADFFRRYTTNALDTNRPGIVHRLDRDTSGVIIGARNDDTATFLKKQFSNRTVKKQYAAVVEGTPKLAMALIDLPIGRNPSSPSTFRVDPKGKSAETTYKVIKSFKGRSLIELKPKTGRTHQLRVHMKYLNTPILGDRVYGQKGVDRLYLHAHKLELTIPPSSRRTFTAPVPKIFKDMVE